jgi:hypothetical protein
MFSIKKICVIIIILILSKYENKLKSQDSFDSLAIQNVNKNGYNDAPFSRSPTCAECQEALQLYNDAYQRSMEFSVDEFLPIVSLIKLCEQKYKSCYDDQAKNIIEYLRYRPKSKYDRQIGDYHLDNFNNFRCLIVQSPSEAIINFKNLYNTKLSPDCDKCIDLLLEYHDAFLKNKFDKNLKDLVYKCKLQILYRDECDKLKRKMSKEKFSEKVIMFCHACGISRMGLPRDVVDKWAFGRPDEPIMIPRMTKPLYDEKLSFSITKDIIFKINGKWGVMTTEGNIFVNPEYDKIRPIIFNKYVYYLVSQNGKTGIFNASGREIFTPKFTEIIDNEIFIRKIKNLKIPENQNIYNVNSSKKQYLLYKYDKKYGVISSTDTSVNISKAFIDSIGYTINYAIIKSEDKYGIIPQTFSSVIRPQYDRINDFVSLDNLVYVQFYINNKCGLLNISTLESTDAKYDQIEKTEINKIFKVKLSSKYGLINSSGIEFVSPKYDEISPFVKLYAMVKSNNKWGLIDSKGVQIIDTKYDKLVQLNNGCSKVRSNGKWGLIDSKGFHIIDTIYNELVHLNNGYSQVSSYGKWGLIDKNGRFIITIKYDEPFSFVDGKAIVKLAGQTLKINERDEIIINDYQEFDFNSLKIDGYTMRYQIEKKFEDLFTDVSSKKLFASVTGTKLSTDQMIIDQMSQIKNTVEGWLNGPMTKTQVNEFNEIHKKVATKYALALAMIMPDEKPSKSPSGSTSNAKNKSKVNDHYCKACPNKIRGNGFSIYLGDEIISGRYKDLIMAKSMHKIGSSIGLEEGEFDNTGDYCSIQCATLVLNMKN